MKSVWLVIQIEKRANNKPSKVIKGSTTVSKTPAKIWKERAVQLIPMSKKSHSFSEQEINDLKKKTNGHWITF